MASPENKAISIIRTGAMCPLSEEPAESQYLRTIGVSHKDAHANTLILFQVGNISNGYAEALPEGTSAEDVDHAFAECACHQDGADKRSLAGCLALKRLIKQEI